MSAALDACTGRRILLALGCLLAFATSASAECAWVLWTNTVSDPAAMRVLLAYETYSACEKEADTKSREVTDAFNAKKIGLDKLVIFRCLPDTVDPRGPKGK